MAELAELAELSVADDEPEYASLEATSFGLSVGRTASQDYFDFAAQFEPMANDSDESKALRVKGFRLADPNGNG